MMGAPGVFCIACSSAAAMSAFFTSSFSMKAFPSRVTERMMGSPPDLSSLTSFASGRVTALPRWSRGVITMKMMSSTSTTSTSGVTLMSLLTPLLPTSIDMTGTPRYARTGLAAFLDEEVHELGGGVVHVHLDLLHLVREVVEEHHGGDGHEQAEGGGHERLGDAGGHGAQAAGAGGGHGLEGGDDAGHGPQQPDERGGGADGGQRAQAAAQVGDGAQRGAVDGAVHRRHQVEVAHVARPLGGEGLLGGGVLL